jgi:hypothetical protein
VLAGAVSGLTDALKDFTTEVRIGMAEREAELTDGLFGDPYPDEPLAERS